MLVEAEEESNIDIPWKVKLLEKWGKPLRNLFLPKIPIFKGCVLGEECKACENNGLTCRQKGVVYTAVCRQCEDEIKQCGGMLIIRRLKRGVTSTSVRPRKLSDYALLNI